MGSSHFIVIYFPFVDLKVHKRLYLVYLTLHMREDVKDMIFILNTNLTSLSFYESWSFNMVS